MMPTKTLMTAREFEAIAGQLGPCELVRGEVVALSPGGLSHSRISTRASRLLGNWAERTGCGEALTNELGLIVETDPDTVRGADVAYYANDRLAKTAGVDGFSEVAPNLVVEVVGKGQGLSQMVRKAGEYLTMGVDRVWVINPASRSVHIYRSGAEPIVLNRGEALADEDILPGFSCKVDDLFTD